MVEVYPNLYIGNQEDYDRNVAHRQGWRVVHACKEPYHRQALGYRGRAAPKDHPEYLIARRVYLLILNLVDAPNPEFFSSEIFDAALDFIHEGLSSGQKVLVHCNKGESRSSGIALLYLAVFTNAIPSETITEAEEAFSEIYPQHNPSAGVRGFLQQNWDYYQRK